MNRQIIYEKADLGGFNSQVYVMLPSKTISPVRQRGTSDWMQLGVRWEALICLASVTGTQKQPVREWRRQNRVKANLTRNSHITPTTITITTLILTVLRLVTAKTKIES